MINQKYFARSFLILAVLIGATACGRHVITETTVISEDPSYVDGVGIELRYINDWGEVVFLTSECIPFAEYYTLKTIDVDNDEVGHSLRIDWEKSGSRITMQLANDGVALHDSRSSTDFYLQGNQTDIDFEIDFVRYHINMHRTSCY